MDVSGNPFLARGLNLLSPFVIRLSEDHIPLIMSQAKARAKPKLATTFQVGIIWLYQTPFKIIKFFFVPRDRRQ